MTVMRVARGTLGRRAAAHAGLVLALLCLAVGASGCSTEHPRPISATELAEAETFPFYRIYWVGATFEGHPLAAADGLRNYINTVGDSVYYGDCVQSKGIFAGGSCLLPLQVTTVVYRLHSNSTLGAQHNLLIRGVPATVYDEGRSIELYSGLVAIDIFSDTFPHALQAADQLRPMNAPAAAGPNLPAPVYCPGLDGPQSASLQHVMNNLPGQACQRAAASASYAKQLTG